MPNVSIYRFLPIYQERIWGGTKLADLYGRALPQKKKIGESWELCDRPEACSELAEPTEGCKSLHDLWKNKKQQVFGTLAPDAERFPILIKILDSTEKLSVQVHPPAKIAERYKGEAKTELWYFLHAEKDSVIYAGLKKGVTEDTFSKSLENGDTDKLLHQLHPSPGDALFLPSGRVHALGQGNVLLEVQQNSDTTYRLFDWNRKDENGKPRQLHIKEGLASIDFKDCEPNFAQPHSERVVSCPYYSVQRAFIFPGEFRQWQGDGSTFSYHFLAQGSLKVGDLEFKPGDGWLVSADHPVYEPESGQEGAEMITVQFGKP